MQKADATREGRGRHEIRDARGCCRTGKGSRAWANLRSLALAQGRDDSHSPATTPTSTGSPLTSDRQPLDPLTRIYFEPNFGRDFRNVRVHTGASAVQFVQDHSAGPLHSERTSTSRQTGIDRVLSTGKGC
jgi:Tfp pilus assembly protein FimT